MTEKKGGIFYGFYMLIAAMFMLIVGTGIVNNTTAQFIKPVTEALGIGRGAMSTYVTFQHLGLMISVMFMGKLYEKFSPKAVTFTGAIVMAVAFGSISFASSVYHLWISGFFVGCGLTFVSTSAASVLMNNWFIKNKGLFIGLCLGGTGLGSTIFNPTARYLIDAYGYAATYQILAVVILVVYIPIFFVYRFKPEEMGLKPYGYNELQENSTVKSEGNTVVKSGLTYAEAVKTTKFYILFFMVFSMSCAGIGTFTHFMAYMTDIGYERAVAAGFMSLVSIVLMVGKPILGFIRDRLGARTMFTLAFICYILSYILLMMIPQSMMFATAFAIIFGFGFCTPTVFSALLTLAAFGEKDFAKIYGSIMIAMYVGPMVGTPLSGWIYDTSGSYTNAWYFYMGLLAVVFCLGQYILSTKKASD